MVIVLLVPRVIAIPPSIASPDCLLHVYSEIDGVERRRSVRVVGGDNLLSSNYGNAVTSVRQPLVLPPHFLRSVCYSLKLTGSKQIEECFPKSVQWDVDLYLVFPGWVVGYHRESW